MNTLYHPDDVLLILSLNLLNEPALKLTWENHFTEVSNNTFLASPLSESDLQAFGQQKLSQLNNLCAKMQKENIATAIVYIPILSNEKTWVLARAILQKHDRNENSYAININSDENIQSIPSNNDKNLRVLLTFIHSCTENTNKIPAINKRLQKLLQNSLHPLTRNDLTFAVNEDKAAQQRYKSNTCLTPLQHEVKAADTGVIVIKDIIGMLTGKSLKWFNAEDISKLRSEHWQLAGLHVKSDDLGELSKSFIAKHALRPSLASGNLFSIIKKADPYIRRTSGDKGMLALTIFIHLLAAGSSAALIPLSDSLGAAITTDDSLRKDGFGTEELTLLSIYTALMMLDFSLDSLKSCANSFLTNRSVRSFLEDYIKTSNKVTIDEEDIGQIVANMWVYGYFQTYISSVVGMPINVVRVGAVLTLISIYYSWEFSLILSGSLFFTILNNILKVKCHTPLNAASNDALDRVINMESDMLMRQTDVKLYDKEDIENQKAEVMLDDFKKTTAKSSCCYSAFDLTQKLNYAALFMGMTILALYYYHQNVSENEFSLDFDDFSFIEIFSLRFIFFLSSFNGEFYNFTDAMLWLGKRINFADQIKEKIPTQPASGREKLAAMPQKVIFSNVSFSANNRSVLQQINFSINKGEKVAIIGASGSGKSTLLKLLFRFYDPTNGEVQFEESGKTTNIKDYELKELRKRIIYLPQRANLFTGTVQQNMLYAKDDLEIEKQKKEKSKSPQNKWLDLLNRHQANREECSAILQDVQLSDAMDKNIGLLSGGQKQKVSLAKAFMRLESLPQDDGGYILIFDEITSALDSENENAIQSLIYDQSIDNTAIIVTHRIRLIEEAVDKIIILDNGQLLFCGTAAEAQNHPAFIKLRDNERQMFGKSGAKPKKSPSLFSKPKLLAKQEERDTTWYDNEDLSILLNNYLAPDNSFYIFTPILGTNWTAGNSLKPQLIQYRDECLAANESFKKLIIPLNLGTFKGQGIHWVLLYIELEENEFSPAFIGYFDPKGDAIPNEINQILMANDVFTQSSPAQDFSIHAQADGYNCGPWIIEAARSLINRDPSDPSQTEQIVSNHLLSINIHDSRQAHLAFVAEHKKSATNPRGSVSSPITTMKR